MTSISLSSDANEATKIAFLKHSLDRPQIASAPPDYDTRTDAAPLRGVAVAAVISAPVWVVLGLAFHYL